MRPSGYTIIEMLVVIVILGLVMSLVIPRFTHARPDASATAVSLSSYLNSASSWASSHERSLCLTQDGGKIHGSWEDEFTVPKELTIALPEICYDQQGRVADGRVIRITDVNDATNTATVDIGVGYGNARPR